MSVFIGEKIRSALYNPYSFTSGYIVAQLYGLTSFSEITADGEFTHVMWCICFKIDKKL